MVRVRVEPTLVEDRIDHGELAEGDPVAGLKLRAMARNGHHPLVVRRKEDRAVPALRVL